MRIPWPLLIGLLVVCAGCGGGGDGGAATPALIVDTAVLAADEESATICVMLVTNGNAVAGTQNELVWDPSCLTLLGSCTVNPDHGKQLFVGGPRLRALVLSFEDVEPIPDGALYCCPFRAKGLEPGDCCPLTIGNQLASDPRGTALVTAGRDGAVCATL